MIEHRHDTRVALAESAPVLDVETGETLGRMINLSLDGFMIVADRPLSPDRVYQLTASIDTPAELQIQLDLNARCVWCQRSSYSTQYGAGFRLEERSTAVTLAIEQLLGWGNAE